MRLREREPPASPVNAPSSPLSGKPAKTSHGRGARPFDVQRWFAALSLGVIVAISAASAALLSRFLTEHMLHRDAVVSLQFIESILQSSNTRPYFVEGADGLAHPALEEFFINLSRIPDVARANIYDREGTVLWSSDANLVGRRFGPNEELEAALRGELAVEVATVGDSQKPEHVTFGPGRDGTRFVENYIPIWNPGREQVIGVVELYKTPQALFRSIDEGTRQIWLSAALGGVVLYLALFGIARHANRVIRRQQQELVESETLASVGEIASAVAHGIRNPLASIRSSAELALEDDPEHARDSLRDIVRETDRLDRWVVDLLHQLRPERAAPERVDPAAVVREALDGYAPACRRQHVTVHPSLPESLPAVRANAAALGQVVNCLIGNALEAMPEGGTLEVSARPERDTLALHITDSGRGLPQEALDNPFRAFRTTKSGGLGVGLSLSRRIVRRYGGELQLANAVGRGVVATLRLPLAD